MMKSLGQSPEEIRAMDYFDFQVHLRIAIAMQSVEQGYNPMVKKPAPTAEKVLGQMPKGGGPRKITQRKKFDPMLGDFVDY